MEKMYCHICRKEIRGGFYLKEPVFLSEKEMKIRYFHLECDPPYKKLVKGIERMQRKIRTAQRKYNKKQRKNHGTNPP